MSAVGSDFDSASGFGSLCMAGLRTVDGAAGVVQRVQQRVGEAQDVGGARALDAQRHCKPLVDADIALAAAQRRALRQACGAAESASAGSLVMATGILGLPQAAHSLRAAPAHLARPAPSTFLRGRDERGVQRLEGV